MSRNECCTSQELLTICTADERGEVEIYYRCPLCGRVYKENTIDFRATKNGNGETIIKKFLNKHPDALVLRKAFLFKPIKTKEGTEVKAPVYSLGYIN